MDKVQTPSWLHATRAPSVSRALQTRAGIMGMIGAARKAVLTPEDPGALSIDVRRTLAARVAQLSGMDGLATDYGNGGAADAGTKFPAFEAILSFTDKVAAKTSDVAAGDIAILQDAGLAEPDIVRLCELIAFVSFEARVLATVEAMDAAHD